MAIMIYRLMRTIVLVMSYIPLRIGQFLGRMLGVVFAMIPIKRTAESLDHIQQSFGNSMSRAEAKKLNRRVIMHFAQMLFEVPHIMKLSPRNLSKYVVFDNEENLLRALEKGKGVFILTGHFGNWELMAGAMAVRFGAGLAVVARPIDFQPLDLLMNELRSRFGTEIIMKQRGMRRVLATIKENKVVGILLDQNVEEEDGRYRIIFENEVRLIKTGDRTKDVEENTARFTNIIDKYVRAHPDHWFWFHRRWKTRPCCSLPDAFYLS